MDRRYLPWFGVVVVMATVLATTSDCARLTATRADEEDDYGANDGDYDGNGGDDANYEASHYHYSSDSQYDDAPSAGDGEAYEDAISVSEAGRRYHVSFH
jgi:hypothetical protein